MSTGPTPRKRRCGGRWIRLAAQGGQVEAVVAWNYPPYIGMALVTEFDYRAQAKAVLESSISDALGPDRPASLRISVVKGNAARVLIDASRGASLLVVGNRGYGGFSEALLGSVGQHCTHHASCPVVIVRGDES